MLIENIVAIINRNNSESSSSIDIYVTTNFILLIIMVQFGYFSFHHSIGSNVTY